MLKKLNRNTVGIPQRRPVKVLQFGGGNFLRGFADWIIDVLNAKTNFNGAIDIITSVNAGTSEQINEQEGLYYLVQQGNKNGTSFSETRLITSVNRSINPSQDFNAFLESAQNPNLEFIISNTTEAGITFEESDKSPNELPQSFPGKLTLLLYHRFKHYNGASKKTLIILPCELIERNGDVLREVVLRYAAHWNLEESFIRWIGENHFCNTLVDRIVPGYPKEQIEAIQKITGFEDSLTVAAEPFYFWAIEGAEAVASKFPTQAAGLEGVVFTQDLAPYRTRKVRILNGAHTVMTPLAYLRGLRTVKEVMDDPFMSAFVQTTIEKEIIPTILLAPNELTDFANDVADRFRNPFIKHQLQSIALNSISKFKVRVLPTIQDYVSKNNSLPQNLIVAFAALICFYRGTWKGAPINLNDSTEAIAVMQEAWKEKSIDITVKHVLRAHNLWGQDLNSIQGLNEALVKAIEQLQKDSNLTIESARPLV